MKKPVQQKKNFLRLNIKSIKNLSSTRLPSINKKREESKDRPITNIMSRF